MATILESDVPSVPRFPQQGSEHPREYREFFVNCDGPHGPYGPARGRAVDEQTAIEGYQVLMQKRVVKLDDVEFTVREIIDSAE